MTTATSAEASENTPLLDSSVEQAIHDHNAIYDRYSNATKRFIVFLVSLCGLIPLFVSGAFIPSIPQMAKDLDSTGPVITLAVSISILTSGIGTLVWATYSTYYGRRPIYLSGLPLLVIGSVGVGYARTVTELMTWRVVQAFGASGGLSVGAGVIGDLYKLEERGTVMGVFFAAVLLGPALAPPAGGFAAHYASWRVMQYLTGAVGLVIFAVMVIWFPETSHPGARGIDQYNASRDRPRRFVLVNPFASLSLLKSPHLMAVMVVGMAALFSDYILLVPLAYTIGKRYNIDNEFFIGACFLPVGLGNAIGAPLAGRISDHLIIKWRRQRGGVWVPEDRLRGVMAASVTLVPLSLLFSGLATRYIDGTFGLVLNLIFLFCNGIGVDLVLTPIAAYCVDIMHSRSAEAMAAASGVRNFIISLAVAGILPGIKNWGVVWTDGLGAIFAWFGAFILWLLIKYGDKMRKWSDVEYSTVLDN